MAAARDPYHHLKRKPYKATFPILFSSLLCLVSIFLVLALLCSPFTTSSVQFLPRVSTSGSKNGSDHRPCNYSDGSWAYDPTERHGRYDHTCKEIFKGWNCVASGKSNALNLVNWRWMPNRCELSPFDASQFLKRYRNTNIGFVGDSLNRNMFVSLFCMLRQASSDVKKWHPARSDRGFTFINHNITIAYHRTNLLVRYRRWSASANGGLLESLGYKEGFRVDVDVPDVTWAEAVAFHDILIFNTGHWWWAPSKFDPVKTPMLFFEKGQPLIPVVPLDFGFDMVLKNMILYAEGRARSGSIRFFRTQSPRHFEGGDWDRGGSCNRLKPLSPEQVEELFSLENNGTNMEVRWVNRHLYTALGGSGFHVLDITHVSEFRADAHPAAAGGKKHDDCMHWCLPGVTDTWNDMFVAHLNNLHFRN